LTNLVVRASATDSLLAVDEVTLVQNTDFVVAPNPANNFITISGIETAAITSISVTDINGRIVKNQSFENVSEVEMNVSDLAQGLYILNIGSKDVKTAQKFIKN